MQARIDTGRPFSALRALGVEAIDVDGVPHLRFRVHPLPEDRTFVLAEARCGADRHGHDGSAHRVIHTRLVIGEDTFPVELELIETSDSELPLRLGRDVLGRRYAVDVSAEALAGPPDLQWHPRPRRR